MDMINIAVGVVIGVGLGLLLRPALDAYVSWRYVRSMIIDRERRESSVQSDSHV
jgi:hypothetical protein